MDFLRASGRAAGLSLHPLQPADCSHVCTLRRPSPGWRTLPEPMPTGLTTCSRVLPEDRRILVLTVFRFVVRSPAGRRRVTLRCAILAYPGS